MSIEANIVTVTPAKAEEWLSANHKNRRIRSKMVGNYARDMSTDRWTLNGESIKIDKHGNLVDGQHRLSAVIESGCSVDMLVITGLEPDAMDTVDTGVKRTASDVVGMKGEKFEVILAAVIRRLILRQRGQHLSDQRTPPSVTEILDFLEEHPDVRDSAAFAANSGLQKIIAPSVVGACHFVFTQIDRDAANWFLGRVIDEDVPPQHPARILKGKMISQRLAGKRPNSDETMYYVVRAWNLYRTGQNPTRINLPREGLNNTTFPMPR